MEQDYITIAGILETGTELVSPHLRWLMRHAIIEHCGIDAVSQIAYCKDIPLDANGKKIWAETFSATRSMALNLLQHFECCVKRAKTEAEMNASVRTLLTRELLDSVIHESHHLKCSFETGDFANSDLEESEARKAGFKKSWRAAEHWDAHITTFGPMLDTLLEKFIAELRAMKEALGDEEADMWVDLQVFMWDNDLAFYDPELGLEKTTHQAFEAMAETGIAWIEAPKQFVGDIQTEQEDLSQEDVIYAEPVLPQAPVMPETQDMEHVNHVPDEAVQVQNAVIPPPPETPTQEVVIPAPPAPVAPAVDDNVLQIQRIVGQVMRTLFVHVMTKCGFNTEGGYNNPTAVLEPISLHTIPGAAELITHMDIQNGVGVPQTLQPCNGFLSGIVDKSGKYPMYKFYMTIGGKQYRRSFIAQNPTLTVEGQLKPWAKAASEGTRIMALYAETGGPTAHLKLEAGAVFGQEEFKIWSQK